MAPSASAPLVAYALALTLFIGWPGDLARATVGSVLLAIANTMMGLMLLPTDKALIGAVRIMWMFLYALGAVGHFRTATTFYAGVGSAEACGRLPAINANASSAAVCVTETAVFAWVFILYATIVAIDLSSCLLPSPRQQLAWLWLGFLVKNALLGVAAMAIVVRHGGRRLARCRPSAGAPIASRSTNGE